LTTRARDFSLTFDNVRADERSGGAHWVATYLFSQTGNIVINDIQARFVFRDGKIYEHHDHFDLCRWSRQALGFKGLLLGWTPLVRNAVRAQALK
ncbi:nuclear transport factor 2 family protein, partial [Pseudomonas viridiflava]|uniref:nuclear transport factor 2 family protein n=1 Tax=Pseudomonas viridiflava TaxID=33069 RepID=UPI003C795438